MVLIDSQKLIRCSVSSQDGIPTARFIEVEVFKLWHYMMKNKHGLVVSDISLCLWVNEEEFKQKEELYARSGEVDSVHRIVISIFDSKNGFSHMTSRYVLMQNYSFQKSPPLLRKRVIAGHLTNILPSYTKLMSALLSDGLVI